MEKLICTPEEAAQALVTIPDKVRELIRNGELPAYRQGTHFKIVISHLKDYIEAKARAETEGRRKEHASEGQRTLKKLTESIHHNTERGKRKEIDMKRYRVKNGSILEGFIGMMAIIAVVVVAGLGNHFIDGMF